MKTIAILALIAAAIPAIASAKTVAGCDVVQVEGANYFNKADPTCAFNTPVGSRVYQEGDVNDAGITFVANDGDATTSLTRTVSDN